MQAFRKATEKGSSSYNFGPKFSKMTKRGITAAFGLLAFREFKKYFYDDSVLRKERLALEPYLVTN